MKNISDTEDHLKNHIKKPMLKIIREKCMDCCTNQTSEVRLCAYTDCALWPYRMGKNPFRKHKITHEQKQKAAKRLKRTHDKEL